MARQVNRLSARTAATLSKPGRHSDGNGLYLVVDPSGAKRWLFLFRWDGKLKEMGLGGLSTTPLIQARERALEARRVLASGRNPIDARRAAAAARQSAATFGAFADELVKDLSHGFRNEKHKGQWVTTLATHAAALRERPLDQIYDISDGATWANKAELGIIVSRHSPQDRLTELGIRKVKFWETGRLGDLHLTFDDQLRAFV